MCNVWQCLMFVRDCVCVCSVRVHRMRMTKSNLEHSNWLLFIIARAHLSPPTTTEQRFQRRCLHYWLAKNSNDEKEDKLCRRDRSFSLLFTFFLCLNYCENDFCRQFPIESYRKWSETSRQNISKGMIWMYPKWNEDWKQNNKNRTIALDKG